MHPKPRSFHVILRKLRTLGPAFAIAGLGLVLACKPAPRTDDEAAKSGSQSEKTAIPARVDAALPAGPRWESQVYRLRIRSAAKKDSSIVGHLAKGEIVVEVEKSPAQVTISGRQGRWIKVQSETKVTGWVFSGFLKKR